MWIFFVLVNTTPVIIIKSTDHKVTTGADWFKGIYDEYVYLAEDLDDAYEIAKRLYIKESKRIQAVLRQNCSESIFLCFLPDVLCGDSFII